MLKQKKQSLLTERGQMFLIAFGFWTLLAFWSISAFWQHVDSLKPAYLWSTRIGACSAEFAILALVFLKCFSKHINVRKWALILGTALIVLVVVHTAGLRGLGEAEIRQADTEDRMASTLTKMAKDQGVELSARRKTQIANHAQDVVAKELSNHVEKVKDASIFPRWYLDGWMYGVLFALSAICLAIPLGMMGNKLDIDADFDGIPDRLQQEPEPSHWPREIDAGK